MSHRLADRLSALRDKYFVGRSAELDLFRSALTPPAERSVSLLFVHGPGGVGKTVLLREYARLAAAGGATVVALDGRNLDPSPTSFEHALHDALQLAPDDSPVEALAGARLPVLLVDTYEVLSPVDTWLREILLPQLPDSALIVLAGRHPPSAAWLADPAWSELAHVLSLRNLPPSDSRAYLRARGLPDEQHQAVLDFTHGHPLALALLTSLLISDRSRPFRPEHAPDIVRSLVERFVERVPTPQHWRALAISAHARVTTESLLADVLDPSQAADLFGWLRELAFVEQGPLGLFPHDIARDVLDAELRWRDPATYRDLHRRIRDACVARLRTRHGLGQQDAYFDFLYLLRHSPISKAYYDWASLGRLYAEVAAPGDHAAIVAMVRRHEGDESARIAQYWLERQPQAFVVFREGAHHVSGFATALHLETAASADLAADPAMVSAWDFIARRAPLRPGESILHHRFFVGRDGYQDTATHNMVAMVATMRWLTTPRLALAFAAVAEPEHWAPMFEPIRFPRTVEADFIVGGHRYGVFAHDWRADPIEQWIDVKLALDPPSPEHPSTAAPFLEVLSRPDFEAAVRQALRDYLRSSLATNPLLRSRLVVDHASRGMTDVACLRSLIDEAVAELRSGPRSEKLYRALLYTYLEPAASQELAAERLGVPFNTYRYQLAAAIKHITDSLWQREVQAA